MVSNPYAGTTPGTYHWQGITASSDGALLPDAAYLRARSIFANRMPHNHYWVGAAYYGFSGVLSFARGFASVPIVAPPTHDTTWISSLSYQPKAAYVPLGIIGIQGG